jgi:hypothetical protein
MGLILIPMKPTNKQTNPQPTRATAPLRYKAWGALMGRAVAHAGEYVFVTPDYRNFPQERADFARLWSPRGYRFGYSLECLLYPLSTLLSTLGVPPGNSVESSRSRW